jgi:hypothetical protein
MNHSDLIQQLSHNLKPVKPQKSFIWRFTVLLFICTLIAVLGVYYWFLKKEEFHIISGRSLVEGILLFLAFVISSSWGTKAASPISSHPTSSKKPILLLLFWFLVLAFSFFMGFLENKEDSLIALKYNTWLCPMVILTIAVPTFLISLFYFFRGAILYPLQAFLYSSILAMSLGALGLSFICPWTDPLHEILWHVLPVFILIGLLTYPLNKIFITVFAHLSAKKLSQ